MLAQIRELALAKDAGNEGRRRRREEHLPAVTGGGDAGRAVDVDADIALIAAQRRARVQAHPDLDRPAAEGRLCLARGRQPGRGRRERREDGVPLGIDLDAAAARDGLAQDPAMVGEHVGVSCVAYLLEQSGRALDIGDEEGHRTARKVWSDHGRRSIRPGGAETVAGGRLRAGERRERPFQLGEVVVVVPG